jgi:hemolysin D
MQSEAEYRRKLYGDMATAEQKAATIEQDVIKAERRANLQVLTAPVDGVVQQLAVHTVGGIVTAAQPLLMVVPAESNLEIEATVSNRDVGFVHAGQEAEIKVDTFNFTKYGLIKGRVLSISQDAITRDKSSEQFPEPGQGSDRPASPAIKQDLSYAARVSLETTQMHVEDKLVNLTPGMAVVVEIKTGTRRIISYLLSPLLKYKQEILRER